VERRLSRSSLKLRWRVASHLQWKIGDGRRLLVAMLRGGCRGVVE